MASLDENLVGRIKTRQIELEEALLIIGGCDSDNKSEVYKSKLAGLIDSFYVGCPRAANIAQCKVESLSFEEQTEVGLALFQYVWEGWTKSSRYVHDTSSIFTNQLPQVIDYHVDPEKSKPVGNCQGLTMLYAVLGIRMGLDICMGKLNWQDSDGKPQGEHTFCALESDGKRVLVENTSEAGFDWDMSGFTDRYEQSNIFFTDIDALAAVAFSERGYLRAKKKNFKEALSDYNDALSLLPEYNLVLVKRALIKAKLNDPQGAIADYDEAIKQNPFWSVPHYNKRMIGN